MARSNPSEPVRILGEDRRRADEAARQRKIQDIANAVRSNIKVRCRYCGTLNEEDAPKCGATL